MAIRKKINILMVCMICVVFGAVQAAQAGYGFGPGSRGCGGKGFYRMMSGLDLTEEQRAAIDDIRDEARSRTEPLFEEIRGLEIPELLLAAEIDVEAVKGAMASAENLRAQAMTIRHEAKLSAAQILTPEQRKALLEQIGECRAGSGRGMGKGGPGRGMGPGGQGMGKGGRGGNGPCFGW